MKEKGYHLKEYNYVYKITYVVTGKIYVGCHQTNEINDGYMGSGIYLKRAYKKYGIDNFKKEIISFHTTQSEMFAAELAIVTSEFVNDDANYNLSVGGRGGYKSEAIYNSTIRSAKIRAKSVNKISVRLLNGTCAKISKDDPRWLSKELVGATNNKATVKDADGNILKVDVDDPRIKTGEFVGVTKGLAVMKDKNGNRYQVALDDPRIKTGELVGNTAGHKQSVESNLARSEKTKGIPKPAKYALCIFCRKSTTLTNLIRWHKNCSYTNMI